MEISMKKKSSTAELDGDITIDLSPDRLNFGVEKPKFTSFKEAGVRERLIFDKFPDYMTRINDVLDSYKDDEGQALKEFRVHVPCLDGANIQRWLEFALARKVEIIEINMFYLGPCCNKQGRIYIFPPQIAYNINTSLQPGLNSLKQLSLFKIHVDDRDVDLFLSNFVLLERLTIRQSQRLKKVSISGHSTLKHLDISGCGYFESMEVYGAMELVSLRCYNDMCPNPYILRLDNVPKLIEFATHDSCGSTLANVLSGISSCIHNQLLHLKLGTVPYMIKDQVFPKLINVKHMELDVGMMGRNPGTYQLFPLIGAFPSLVQLHVKFSWFIYDEKEAERPNPCYNHRENRNKHLKKVTFSGFLGCDGEVEFATYILMHVESSLQEFIVELCNPILEIPPKVQEIRDRARRRAHDNLVPILNKWKPLFVQKPDDQSSNLHFVAANVAATALELST